MGIAFARSERSLTEDRSVRSIGKILVVSALLLVWGAWFLFARVAVCETSTRARLEVESAAHPLASALDGRVLANRVVVGRIVKSGDVLVELDAEVEKRQLEEERRHLAAIAPQIASAWKELAAREQAEAEGRRAAEFAFDEARATRHVADTEARLAGDIERRLDHLHARGGVPEVDMVRAHAEVDKRQASVQASTLDVQRLQGEQRTVESQARASIENLRRDIAALEGQRATSAAAVAVLEESIERHLVRAPVDGSVGESANVPLGSMVRQGERLGTVIPSGRLRVIADFAPAAALGRVRVGQRARMLLDGFPWTQYGAVDAVVTSVSQEVRDGLVRVELQPRGPTPAGIPLQHGMPGTLEVEVERRSPAVLVLRAAGKLVTRDAGATESP